MNTALVLAACLLVPTFTGQVELEPAMVKMEQRAGIELWTVRARESSARQFLARVAELSGREVDATSALERAPLITIELDRRPLDVLLEFALGSAGLCVELTDERIFVRADRGEDDTLDQRIGLAAAAWARAASRYPEHPVAASARLAQGQLDELRGHPDSARSFYLDVLTRDPGSGSASEAYLRAGRLAAERCDWSEASEHFRALANLDGAEEYRAVARVELARATLYLGDAASALHILDALDVNHPCWDRTEATARALVRIEALLAAQRFQEALLELESRAARFDSLGAREVPRLRALALAGAGMPEDASRAWLLVAHQAVGPARVEAYRTAADLAFQAHDALGVLFVARAARAAGFGAAVADLERLAKQQAGVEDPARATAPALEARLAQAELWLEKEQLEHATAEFEPLFTERGLLSLSPEQMVRVVLGWARCVQPAQGIEAAATLAASTRAQLDGNARRQLDCGMARLFEDCALFERAADAYQGEY